MIRPLAALLAPLLLSGCFLDRNGAATGMDSGPPADAGPAPDVGTFDSGTCVPTTELCNGEGDEDCDGIVDEGCDCANPGITRVCGTNLGECVTGSETCQSDGRWGLCMGAVMGRDEICNRLDDDCDGTADDFDVSCSLTRGVCTAGVARCARGVLGECSGIEARPEECDVEGLDEDCDGEVNEDCDCVFGGLDRPCRVGYCIGTQPCLDTGIFDVCMVSPETEECDGTDQDCDGAIDNDADCVGDLEAQCEQRFFMGSSYLICAGNLSWDDAQSACGDIGYQLVVIDSPGEQAFVATAAEDRDVAVNEAEYWIGLTDVGTSSGEYEWVDGSALTFEVWGGPNPNGNDECVMLDVDLEGGAWDDKGCGGGRGFVCEANRPTGLP